MHDILILTPHLDTSGIHSQTRLQRLPTGLSTPALTRKVLRTYSHWDHQTQLQSDCAIIPTLKLLHEGGSMVVSLAVCLDGRRPTHHLLLITFAGAVP
jgi:hypothetical protein